jgi:hypothetical protein
MSGLGLACLPLQLACPTFRRNALGVARGCFDAVPPTPVILVAPAAEAHISQPCESIGIILPIAALRGEFDYDISAWRDLYIPIIPMGPDMPTFRTGGWYEFHIFV